jgi:ABC-type nitrate/sulfonate/bicarbonate transport system permease component
MSHRSLSPMTRWLLGAGTILAMLVVWELASVVGLISSLSMPAASTVFSQLVHQLFEPAFWSAAGHTISSAVLALVIVTVLAIPLALAIGTRRLVEESTWGIIEFLKPVPPVAMIPLGLLLWGPTETMKLVITGFACLWPLLTQLVYGIQRVDKSVLDMARSYRLSFVETTTRIVIPSLLPYALTGMRVSASIAVVVTIVTELIGGAPGLGQSISVAQTGGRLDVMYALIIVTGLLGLLINYLFKVLERPLLFWHPSVRQEVG